MMLTSKIHMYVSLKSNIQHILKQTSKCLNTRYDNVIRSLYFKYCLSNNFLYIKHENNVILYLILYIDEIIIVTDSVEHILKLKSRLNKKCPTNYQGELNYF